MITYKDKTFCTSHCDNFECHRKLSYSESRHAEQVGLPIAFCDFKDGCDTYIEPKEKSSVPINKT